MAVFKRSNRGLSTFFVVATVATSFMGVSTVIADDISLHTNAGDIATTGFSGIIKPDATEKLPSYDPAVDETFINPAGISAKIITLREPKKVWQGQELTLEIPNSETNLEKKITASQVGQVFGVAFDNAKYPNLYLTATSSYGLNIVQSDICEKDLRDKDGKTLCAFVNSEDVDTRPERMQKGGNYARWMKGQWGIGGGAGTVWRVSGKTGKVSVFANITFEGKSNAGASLGNITFDKNHQQIFVSDLDTGMIHRLSLKGKNLETYDHGVTGR